MPNSPNHRSTRSGSNASAVSLNDIKVLIESSKTEILDAVKQENDQLRSMIATLTQRLIEMESVNRDLLKKTQSLEEKYKNLESRLQGREGASSDEELIREAMERHRRRKYLIVSGLSESSHGSVEQRRLDDTEKIRVLASTLGIEDFSLDEVSRLGRISEAKGRLLRFKCAFVDDKLSLLRSSKELRNHAQYDGVFINPDLTLMQRKINRQLRSELKRRREAGENVVIRHGRIIDKSELGEKNFQ